MSDKPDGGPAFPWWDPGMSLRDAFAIGAYQRAYIPLDFSSPGNPTDEELQRYADKAAKEAYRIADAMLAEREKTCAPEDS